MDETAALGAVELTDRVGQNVSLGSLWADQTVVLAFIRHFG